MTRRESEGPNYNGQNLGLKDRIRARDGYKCRQCGMTQEEHKKRFGRILNVHRKDERYGYYFRNCITLCQPCHYKQPKWRMVQIRDGKQVVWGNYGPMPKGFEHREPPDSPWIKKKPARRPRKTEHKK